MDDVESIRAIVCQRIEQIEDAMKSLHIVRKSLIHKAYEAKQTILNTYISQRDSMQCEEVELLAEVDKLLHSKDDALVTQLSKLSQVLGCLRNCLQSPHPCGECLEKFEDIDMLSVNEVSVEFSAANEMLTNRIKSCPLPLQRLSTSHSYSASDGGDTMTKWLLTPSNNHSEIVTLPQDFRSTEWLIEHHVYASAEAEETACIFASVKKEEADLWLNRESLTSTPHNNTFMRFDQVSAQDNDDWLSKKCRQLSLSDDGTMVSDSTSSLGSSCVVLSGTTSEDGSTFSYPAWTKNPVRDCNSPYEVSQWVATCKAADGEESGTDLPDSERSMSIDSCASSVVEPTEVSRSEWLSQSYKSVDMESIDEDMESVDRATWLTYSGDPCALVSADEEWLNTTHKIDASMNWDEEKSDQPSDNWLSKASYNVEVSAGHWLQSSMRESWLPEVVGKSLSSVMNDWLTEEEKRDEPKGSGVSSQLDREWLLVKNELSRIVYTPNSDWIVGNQTVTLMDNRLCSNNS